MNQGIYEQLISSKLKQQIDILESQGDQILKQPLEKEEAHLVLSKYVQEVVQRALVFIREDRRKDRKDKKDIIFQIELCNKLIQLLSENLDAEEFEEFKVSETSEILLSIYSRLNSAYAVNDKVVPVRPATSIATSSLFTGSTKEPDMVSELNKEIQSANRIDMLISFIKWSGLRLIYDSIKKFVSEEGKKVRIITTCYMGATDARAIEALAKLPNVEIKISYDTKHTRLHAKSYLFYRDTGFTTAYIGSSNMSKAAMTSGLEWNLKVSEKDSFEVVRKFKATFDSYWSRYDFETYEHNNPTHNEKLRASILNERSGAYDAKISSSIPLFDIRPYEYQEEILEQLKAERLIFGRYKNLVIAATGVGKTVIAAFDFKRYYKENSSAKLLFVAHREEILVQSIQTFRGILKDPDFGEMLTGTVKPTKMDHLFVMINSLNSNNLTEKIDRDYYDFVIVDEFHHSAANSYVELLDYFEPKILLGLTATPERMDGKNILEYFDGKIASEMRLPEAIDHKLLAPFHYFCVTDNIDLSTLKWSSGGYQDRELSNLYIANHEQRVRTVINSMNQYLSDIDEVKGIGFCVTVDHANYMAKSFNELGIPAVAVVGTTEKNIRREAKTKLTSGEIKMVFTVDVYNEGVDIPELDLLLFLRPTESPIVFLQQLGRGLRTYEGKSDVRVLDFIGNFKKVDLIPFLLGNRLESKKDIVRKLQNGEGLPLDCQVDFEFQVIDLIESVLKSKMKIHDMVDEWFTKCREEQEDYKIPSRMEFFKWLNDDQYQAFKKQRKYNPFKDYIRFTQRYDSSEIAEELLTKDEYRFIQCIETTGMSQLYKIPVIKSFIEGGKIKKEVTIDDIIDSFIDFYGNNRNRLDIVRRKTMGEPRSFTKSMWRKVILNNPVKFLAKTHGDIFEQDGEVFRIKLEFDYIKGNNERYKWFVAQVEDTLAFRRGEFLDQRLEKVGYSITKKG